MERFRLFAHPWWVNLLALAPFLAYFLFQERKPELTRRQLLTSATFALSFGLVESAAAVYLGVAAGVSFGNRGSISEAARLVADLSQPSQFGNLALSLLTVEILRELSTILMLLSVAFLAAQDRRERLAVFLWMFALWDLGYYAALWTILRWPSSLTNGDVLFLVPVPWISQVWFPILISTLTLGIVFLSLRPGHSTPSPKRR